VKKYVVNLSEQEEKQLRELTRKGKTGARRLRRAHVLQALVLAPAARPTACFMLQPLPVQALRPSCLEASIRVFRVLYNLRPSDTKRSLEVVN
jgi:hypothetical protein